jgi:hypothetical protein
MSIKRWRRIGLWLGVALVALLVLPDASAAAMEFPGPDPGKATARLADGRLILENASLAATWLAADGKLRLAQLEDRLSGKTLRPTESEAFRVSLVDGTQLTASQFHPAGEPTLVRLDPEPEAVQASKREAGWQATMLLTSPDGRLEVRWTATLRDRSNYLRTELTVAPSRSPTDLAGVVVLEIGPVHAEVAGTVSGSPVVAGNLFFACEHPLAENRVEEDRIECSSRYRAGSTSASEWSRSAVLGVAPPDQLRRAFLYYVERERARPYRLFLHYNSWWDIAWPGRRMDEAQCLDVMEQFGRELFQKRGVALDSFVFDDGWDDPKTLWQFHGGFPRGFAPHQEAAKKQDSAIGVWLSPWGGYGQAKVDRLEYGKTQGFETNSRGFSLAGPTYYARYAEACKQMISKYGANYFKFDGIGQGLGSPGADDEVAADVESLLRLAGELRSERPDIYLSITTGTWPSPYWLWYGDSVWRNGHDLGFHGAGSMREQSITYRDMFVRRMIVDRAPLYPLNSLMIVSLCQAQLGTAAKMVDDLNDLPDEIRMAFAGGTQLLELYVTPSRMTREGWDVLAECARWSRENADVLVDVHWVGGDPGEAEAYGYAAWSPRKGLLTLRNPADEPQSISLSLADAFDLPKRSGGFRITTPWSEEARGVPDRLAAGETHEFKLQPLEILLIEAVPEE